MILRNKKMNSENRKMYVEKSFYLPSEAKSLDNEIGYVLIDADASS